MRTESYEFLGQLALQLLRGRTDGILDELYEARLPFCFGFEVVIRGGGLDVDCVGEGCHRALNIGGELRPGQRYVWRRTQGHTTVDMDSQVDPGNTPPLSRPFSIRYG